MAHKLWQIGMPQELPNRHIFAGVVPVVVDGVLKQIAKDQVAGLAVNQHMLLQRGRRDGIQPGVAGLGDLPPDVPGFIQRRGTVGK